MSTDEPSVLEWAEALREAREMTEQARRTGEPVIVAQQKGDAGMGTWHHTLRVQDVFHNDELTFEEKRDKIVERIKQLPPYVGDTWLQNITEELADAGDADEFDGWWDEFYDWADEQRVWVSTV